MRVLGVDVWKSKWLGLVLEETEFVDSYADESLESLIDRAGPVTIVGIDMPFPLVDAGNRRADVEARRRVGPRASSVFNAPGVEVVGSTDYQTANQLSKDRYAKGLSKQSFALFPKIVEIRAFVAAQKDGPNIVEVHPEVSFAELRKGELAQKKTWLGVTQRIDALWSVGLKPPSVLSPEAEKAPTDDVLDACVTAWSAQRSARGESYTVPSGPEIDPRLGIDVCMHV